MRHTYNTLLMTLGVHQRIVADMMGHTTSRMLDEVYQQVSLDQKADAMKPLGKAVLGDD